MGLPKVCRDNDCLYLIQDISGFTTYDKSKAIVNFCDKETKNFEKEIDRAVLDIFERNGINIPNTEKSVLKLAFDLLNVKGTKIEIVDLFKSNIKNDNCEFIKETKNHFVVMLEWDNVGGEFKEILQCGVRIKEIVK